MVTLNEDFYANRWARANIPVRYRGQRFAEYEPVNDTGKFALYKSQTFVEEFRDHYISRKRAAKGDFPEDRSKIGKGLIFIGPNGTRKTSLACTILTEVQYRGYGFNVFYIRFSDWKKALTDTFEKEESELKTNAFEILEKANKAHLLLLDDIGQEHRTASGFTQSSLHEFLRVRHEAGLPTIATSNKGVKDLEKIYDESFGSFMFDAFSIIPVEGRDTRRVKD